MEYKQYELTCLSVEKSLIKVLGVSEVMFVVGSIFSWDKSFTNPSFDIGWSQPQITSWWGTLTPLLSYKDKIIGTETDLLQQSVLKITFIAVVAIVW